MEDVNYRLAYYAASCKDVELAASEYPDTIAGKYAQYILDNKIVFDWAKLREIALEVETDTPDGLVVHFRMGDRHLMKHELLDFINSILKTEIMNVTIMSHKHLHWELMDGDGQKELDIVTKMLESKGRTVTLRDESPDEDFAFMIRATDLHTSIGIFGILAALCCDGNVYHSIGYTERLYDMYNEGTKTFVESPTELVTAMINKKISLIRR